LIKDPPFSRLDLISCRNLLIYLEGGLQKQVFPRFHYALRHEGYLFLGPAENVTGFSSIFESVDAKHRIFRRRDAVVTVPVSPPGSLHWRMTGDEAGEQAKALPEGRRLLKSLERVILDQYGPACVVVNHQHDIVYFSGRTSRFLEAPAGAPTTNVVSMARRGLRTKLRSALRQVISSRSPLTQEGITVQTGDGMEEINLIVRPMPEFTDQAGLFAIVFKELGERPGEPAPAREEGSSDAEVLELERELRVTREDLEGSVDQLEASNEQLKSSNEELMAMNEELQSANEEFETSKEELQSVNEEMATINSELNEKVDELDEATSDLRNFIDATKIPTLLLDRDLQIQRFTPGALELFRLIPGDVGRPIQDIRARFDASQMFSAVGRVMATESAEEQDVIRAKDDRTYVMRALPYRATTGELDGSVVTFVDVTAVRGLERESASEDRLVFTSMDA
ncbi:MAG: PAS domain-containing protein, partial [Gemmatimonadales bacterium]